MKQLISVIFLSSLLVSYTFGQVELLSSEVSTYTTASEGDYYITTDTDELYVGTSNGELRPVGIVTRQGNADGEVLAWNATDEIWASKAPSTGALTLTKAQINTVNKARITIQSAGNINAGTTFTIVPNTIEFNQTNASISGNTITGLEGHVRFIVQPYLRSSTQRSNFICEFIVNGISTKRLAGPLYARNADNHNATGAPFIFEQENVSPTDTFSFALIREARSGIVALLSDTVNTSYIFIEQSQSIEVVTDVSAPVDLSIAEGPPGPPGPPGPQGPAGSSTGNPTDVYHASANIAITGTINYQQGVSSVLRLSTGRYRITFDTPHSNGANYPIIITLAQNQSNDDYITAYNNVTASSFDVEIGEQDNGGSPGSARDVGFSFFVPL